MIHNNILWLKLRDMGELFCFMRGPFFISYPAFSERLLKSLSIKIEPHPLTKKYRGQLHTMIIRGVQREQIGYVESIDSDGTFVLKNMFGVHIFDVKNIKFLCV